MPERMLVFEASHVILYFNLQYLGHLHQDMYTGLVVLYLYQTHYSQHVDSIVMQLRWQGFRMMQ